ncbi:MAG: hypothetical protein ACOX7U_05700 [Desulfitobacteriia bacterium]
MRKVLYVEITPWEVRFLLQTKSFGKKAARVSFSSIPLANPAPQETELTWPEILPGKKELQAAFKDFRKRIPGKRDLPVYLFLPFQSGFRREIKFPWLPYRERDLAISYYLQHEMPFLTEESIFRYQVLEEKRGDYLQIQVIALKKDILDFYVNCLTETGYVLKGVEYSAWAFAYNLNTSKTTLLVQKTGPLTIELVLCRNSTPILIREIRNEELDNYSVYRIFGALEQPIEFVITDKSLEADRVASFLIEAGIIEELKAPPLRDDSLQPRFKTYALLGGIQRVQKGRNINFYHRQARSKNKRVFISAILIWGAMFFFGSWYWQSQISDYNLLQQEIATLTKRVAEHQDGNSAFYTKWQKAKQDSLKDLPYLGRALGYAEEECTLTRWYYKGGTLIIWAEGQNSRSLPQLIEDVLATGWKEPEIINYRLQKENISFSLRFNR